MSAGGTHTQSYAVLVRGLEDEAPYLPAFVNHYLTMGFSHIYFINTGNSDDFVRRCLSPEQNACLTVLQHSNQQPNWQLRAVNAAMALVREDWFLNVDMDEFLFLQSGAINDIVAPLPSDVEAIRFQWRLCLVKDYLAQSSGVSPLHATRSRLFKTMSRTVAVMECGLHDVHTRRGRLIDFNPEDDHAWIWHFAARGYYDLLSRIVGRHYEDAKSGASEETKLLRFLSEGGQPLEEQPFRFNLFRLQLAAPKLATKPSLNPLTQADSTLIRRLFIQKLSQIGLNLPVAPTAELDAFCEDVFCLSKQLTGDLPPRRFIELHLHQGKSYQYATHAYLEYLRDADGRQCDA